MKTIILIIMLATAALSQEDCPNPVANCTDVCEGQQCDRFLNAECEVNPCNGECTPFFIWRGRDVTERCTVPRCSNRNCPGKRVCIERIIPESCPSRFPNCRQYVNTRCAFPRNCEQLLCEAGTICKEAAFGIPQCIPSVADSCDELKCPRGTVCVSQGIPSRGLSVAQCLNEEEASALPTVDTFFCNSGAAICSDPVNEACIDIYDGGRLFLASCLQIGCDVETNFPCPDSRVCTTISDRPFSTACIGTTSVLGTNCTDDIDRCPTGQNCRETFVNNELLFSTCGITAESFTGPSCEELECLMPLVCNDLESVEGAVGLARCAGPEFTNTHETSVPVGHYVAIQIKCGSSKEFLCHESGMVSLGYSRATKQTLFCGDRRGDVLIFDLRQMSLLHNLGVHGSAVNRIVVNDVNGIFATGSADGDIKVLDINSFEEIVSYPGLHAKSRLFRQTKGGVTDLGILPGGKLYSCGGDGSVQCQTVVL